MDNYLLFILIGDQQHLSTLHSSAPMQNKSKVFVCVCMYMHMYVCAGMIMTQCLCSFCPPKNTRSRIGAVLGFIPASVIVTNAKRFSVARR